MVGNSHEDAPIYFGFLAGSVSKIEYIFLRPCLSDDVEISILHKFNHVGSVHKDIRIGKGQCLQTFIEIGWLVDHGFEFIVSLGAIWTTSYDLLG